MLDCELRQCCQQRTWMDVLTKRSDLVDIPKHPNGDATATTILRARGDIVGWNLLLRLASLGVVTAASTMVSGSIVVVGDAVYWAEERANCVSSAKPSPAASASS